ncbi:hypothetical protein G7Y79_00009g027500 [Physcia stellaris]|nr:hypothetical protein G7Y79_00009g027500 [Physcia stellaris]
MASNEPRLFSNDAPHGVRKGQQAYNDWPNDSGFEVFHEDLEPVELKVSGKIPAFAALIERVRRTGDLSSITFGQKIDPCESFFKKIMCSFEAVAGRGSRDATDINIGVTVQKNLPGLPNLPGIKRKAVKDESAAAVSSLWLKTDNSTLQQLDPASL